MKLMTSLLLFLCLLSCAVAEDALFAGEEGSGDTDERPIPVTPRPTQSTRTTQDQTCPPGWRSRGPGTSCYYISNHILNWTAARQYCRQQGADLVAIESSAEQSYIRSLLDGHESTFAKEPLWIGLNDRQREGRWMWNDETPLGRYTNWRYGEPNNVRNCLPEGEDCGCIYHKCQTGRLGQWNDCACHNPREFICEKAHEPSGLTVQTACNHGSNQQMTLNCQYKKIDIQFAIYGRLDSATTCPNNGVVKSNSCFSTYALDIVRDQCQGKSTCRLSAAASSSVFDDPCSGTEKYLKVGYKCI